MSGFPGSMFGPDGISLDARVPDLAKDMLALLPCRSIVTRDGLAPIARAWVLRDDATFADIPAVLRAEAVNLVLAGRAILILAARPEPAADVRDGLLSALDLFVLPNEAGGHA